MAAALIAITLIALIVAGLLTIAFTGDDQDEPEPTNQHIIYTQAGKVKPGHGLMKR
jgi:hypothetical protein